MFASKGKHKEKRKREFPLVVASKKLFIGAVLKETAPEQPLGAQGYINAVCAQSSAGGGISWEGTPEAPMGFPGIIKIVTHRQAEEASLGRQ